LNLLKSYIQGFLNRSGSYVITATIIARGFSFLASWIALQLLSNKTLGVVLFSFSIVQFLIPFGGFGLHQGLLRYGALLKSREERNTLFIYVLKKGVLFSVFLLFLIITIGYFIPFEFENTYFYISILSLGIISNYFFQIIKIQYRLHHNNKFFAFIDIAQSIVLLVTVLCFSYFFKETGYAVALIISPLSSLFFLKNLHINYQNNKKPSIINRSFWRYCFLGSLASVAPQSLVIIDILLIGHLLKDPELVTAYKYVSIIPASILFLPQAFIATDYVSFTEKITNKPYIFNYIKSYMLLFSLIGVLFCGFFYLFSNETLVIFSVDYIQYSDSFSILVFGVCGILIFRGLFGNLLSSIGKIEVNYYIVSIALVLNVISNYYLLPIYGIKGAAITSAFLMWFTGIFSYVWFIFLYKKLHGHAHK